MSGLNIDIDLDAGWYATVDGDQAEHTVTLHDSLTGSEVALRGTPDRLRTVLDEALAKIDADGPAPEPLGPPADFAWGYCADIPWHKGVVIRSDAYGDRYVLEAQRERCAHGGHWTYELVVDHPDRPVVRVDCDRTIRWRPDTGPDSMQAARDAASRLLLEEPTDGEVIEREAS